MSTILLNFWSIIAVMGVGYIVARLRIVPTGTDGLLTRIAFNTTLPSLVFIMVSQGNPRDIFSPVGLTNIFSAVAVAVIYVLIARFALGVRGTELTVGALIACYTNIGNLGIAFLVAITGDATAAAPILLFQICVLLPFFFAILDRQTGQSSGGLWVAVKRMITNPLLIAVAVGLLVSVLKIPVPEMINGPLKMMSQANVPIILLAMGISLYGAHLPRSYHDAGPLILGVVMRCIGGPLTVLLMGWAMGITGPQLMSIMIVGTFPTANNVFVFAHKYKANVSMARDAVLLTTFGSLIVILGIAVAFHSV